MKPSTDRCLSHERLSSANTSDVQAFTVPRGTSHIDISVETVNARITFDGLTPSATYGSVWLAGQNPVFRPLGQGTTIKFVSTAASPSIVVLSYYS